MVAIAIVIAGWFVPSTLGQVACLLVAAIYLVKNLQMPLIVKK